MSAQTTALATTNGAGALAINGGFTREQMDLLKRTVADGTSDDEFALFTEVCKGSGLNPFHRQIYAIMRETYNKKTRKKEPKMTIQTGIDGYRLMAARTGQHAGTTDAEYGPIEDGWPSWALVTVRRLMPGGAIADFTATARWKEYVQAKEEWVNEQKTGRSIPSGQWPTMPYLMLGKCAEALALRKAFPAELSGVYTNEEMTQADSEHAAIDAAPVASGWAPSARVVGDLCRAEKLSRADLDGVMERSFKGIEFANLTRDAFDQLLSFLRHEGEKRRATASTPTPAPKLGIGHVDAQPPDGIQDAEYEEADYEEYRDGAQ